MSSLPIVNGPARLTRYSPYMGWKVILDPGHGGKDGGAVNTTYNLEEADVNLAIAGMTALWLKCMGVEVHMTRSEDVFLSLQERCDFANRSSSEDQIIPAAHTSHPKAIFISIHMNSVDNASAAGIETFTSTNPDLLEKDLAETLQQELLSGLHPQADRGVKQKNLYVLNHTNIPAVLVEIGFISHPATAQQMLTNDWRMRASSALCTGIRKYMSRHSATLENQHAVQSSVT